MKSIKLDKIVEDDDLILPKLEAQLEYNKEGHSNVMAEVSEKCQKFTLWDQLGARGREILLQAPMNK